MDLCDATAHNKTMEVFQELIMLAFFFALRSCEYLHVGNADHSKPVDRRTHPLRKRSFQFRKNHRIVPHDDYENLLTADSVTLLFEWQKKDERNDIVTQMATGHARYCPVVCSAKTIIRMNELKKKGLATEDSFIYIFLEDDDKMGKLTGKLALKMLRDFIRSIDYKSLGLIISRIGLHSLRSSAAMAMYMNHIPVYTIMLLGRWSNDAFLRYIRKQVEQFGHNVAKLMIQNPVFHSTVLASRDDPRNHNPLSVTANMGMGSSGAVINRAAFSVWQ